ncbi:MAG: hypothetical protein HFI76_10995 [Lachnospiraceae bacterium]|nr:hypothetical protein [Lachnospiraceae bacterium]
MSKRHKAHDYKFSGKVHSKKGIAGLMLALLSAVFGIALITVSFLSKGNGSMYLGSGGVLALLLSVVSLMLAVQGLREENSYRFFPLLALGFGLLTLAGWGAVYAAGALYL